MIGYCNECPDRDMCEDLCEAALAWADQDQFEEDPNKIVYASPRSLAYLQDEFPLKYNEMIGDIDLGIQEWHYVKKCGLTEQQMQCMWLYYWEKLTLVEIGEKLGITKQTVHQHLVYAKKKLVKMLKNEQ
ncbi:MAG: sigma factor-like helix-turn-helix DNA-binding protein [Promethearchaeota archaeon]